MGNISHRPVSTGNRHIIHLPMVLRTAHKSK